MLLGDNEILSEISEGNIKIEPFDRDCLGSNSYDVHLSKYLATQNSNVDPGIWGPGVIDPRKPPDVTHFEIPPSGYLLKPWTLYLGSTVEYTECYKCVPSVNGKSSTGRLGIFIHVTAGQGDVGFLGYWTLEIIAAQPIVVYPGMVIGQLSFEETKGKILVPYHKKASSKYVNRDPRPQPSKMWKNFLPKELD